MLDHWMLTLKAEVSKANLASAVETEPKPAMEEHVLSTAVVDNQVAISRIPIFVPIFYPTIMGKSKIYV
jgi:hypothetical protein